MLKNEGLDLNHVSNVPDSWNSLLKTSKEIGFNMPSDIYIGTLLRSLVSSKPGGKFLELGTGMGLSLCWMVDGLDEDSSLISVENDPKLLALVTPEFESDPKVQIVCQDGEKWIKENSSSFDLIFADTWPGKYSHVEETLSFLKPGGIYVIDDLLPQPNWPDGHLGKAKNLLSSLEERTDFVLTKMNWSTGVVICTKV